MSAILLQNPISVSFFIEDTKSVDDHEDELQVASCFEHHDPTFSNDELDEYN